MSQYNNGEKGFLAVTALGADIRVKLSGGGVIACGAGEKGVGFTRASAVINAQVNVKLDNDTVEATASGTIAVNDDCWPAAAGDVANVASGVRCGIALEAATDGETFEMMLAGPSS